MDEARETMQSRIPPEVMQQARDEVKASQAALARAKEVFASMDEDGSGELMCAELRGLLDTLEADLRAKSVPPYTKSGILGKKSQSDLDKARDYLRRRKPTDAIDFHAFLVMLQEKPWSEMIESCHHSKLPMAAEIDVAAHVEQLTDHVLRFVIDLYERTDEDGSGELEVDEILTLVNSIETEVRMCNPGQKISGRTKVALERAKHNLDEDTVLQFEGFLQLMCNFPWCALMPTLWQPLMHDIVSMHKCRKKIVLAQENADEDSVKTIEDWQNMIERECAPAVKEEANQIKRDLRVTKVALKKCTALGIVAAWAKELKEAKLKKAARKAMLAKAKEETEAQKEAKRKAEEARLAAIQAAEAAEVARLEEIERLAVEATLHIPEQYDKIQDALDAVEEGGRIQIAPGVYNELVVLNKNVHMFGGGDDRTRVVLRFDGGGNTLTSICTDGRLSRLTLQNIAPKEGAVKKATRSESPVRSPTSPARSPSPTGGQQQRAGSPVPTLRRSVALMIPQGQLTVENCDISSECGAGVCVVHPGTEASFRKCLVHECEASGILVADQAHACIEDCVIATSRSNGVTIQAEGTTGMLTRCKVIKSRKDGILVTAQGEATISNCEVNRSKKAGVNLQEGAKAELEKNVITRNKDGVNVLTVAPGVGGTRAVLASGNNLGGNRQDNLYIDEECLELVTIDLDNQGLRVGQ